jgi:uncharacterized protein (TIGR02996 family)
MNEDAEFVRAIRDKPDDVTLRLVYADWLDERNDPRGEYIRLKRRLAEITARLTQLGEQIDPTWLAAVRGPKGSPEEFTLRSGRSIRLRELRQWDVYEGLLEGLPTTEMNSRTIEGVLTDLRQEHGCEPYLIRPQERPLKHPRRYRFGTPATLPEVVCVGRFDSFQPARDASRQGSMLPVIWFQDEFALPIDPVVREQIRAIDWEQHATDFDW